MGNTNKVYRSCTMFLPTPKAFLSDLYGSISLNLPPPHLLPFLTLFSLTTCPNFECYNSTWSEQFHAVSCDRDSCGIHRNHILSFLRPLPPLPLASHSLVWLVLGRPILIYPLSPPPFPTSFSLKT